MSCGEIKLENKLQIRLIQRVLMIIQLIKQLNINNHVGIRHIQIWHLNFKMCSMYLDLDYFCC